MTLVRCHLTIWLVFLNTMWEEPMSITSSNKPPASVVHQALLTNTPATPAVHILAPPSA